MVTILPSSEHPTNAPANSIKSHAVQHLGRNQQPINDKENACKIHIEFMNNKKQAN